MGMTNALYNNETKSHFMECHAGGLEYILSTQSNFTPFSKSLILSTSNCAFSDQPYS